MYVRENGGGWQLYYIFRDYLGSIMHITNSSGAVVQELSYDAWGRLRDPAMHVVYEPGNEPDLFLGRGYTGHEHLPRFGLINMNARLYDPVLGRFLSPDPYIQAPDFTQNFNRYSYCLNNPLKFTDPSGEFLTWSIGRHGFRIGFNLSPIGIPLGAGINIGWSDGGSVGVYGEVGYRVGGTGLGAGATLSQSFDYGFQAQSWSTTTGVGVYGSLGLFNAGGHSITSYSDITLEYITNASISDGRIKKPNFWNKLGFGKNGYYEVYLVIDQGKDYHWYRQDKGGSWSHKPGITPVTNVDASGRFISNPAKANHNYGQVNYNKGARRLWVKR